MCYCAAAVVHVRVRIRRRSEASRTRAQYPTCMRNGRRARVIVLTSLSATAAWAAAVVPQPPSVHVEAHFECARFEVGPKPILKAMWDCARQLARQESIMPSLQAVITMTMFSPRDRSLILQLCLPSLRQSGQLWGSSIGGREGLSGNMGPKSEGGGSPPKFGRHRQRRARASAPPGLAEPTDESRSGHC